MVRPVHPGNLGAAARACANFGITDLRLVDPCPIDDEAEKRSMHGLDILKAAEHHEDLGEALDGLDIVVATTGKIPANEKKVVRAGVFLPDLLEELKGHPGNVGFVFGTEDRGLSNEEIALASRVVSIPASAEYPILNLSHSVAVLLSHVFLHMDSTPQQMTETQPVPHDLRVRLQEQLVRFLDVVAYPEHKKERTSVVFRRVVERAEMTEYEYNILMGIFKHSHLRYMEPHLRIHEDEEPDHG